MNRNKNIIYLNIFDYADDDYPFQIFIGGRGTGKTFSALSGAVEGSCAGKSIYMRRTLDAWELSLDTKSSEGANPYKSVNREHGSNLGYERINKKLAGLYARETDEDGNMRHVGAPLGYSTALGAVARIRGLDFSEVSDIIYDEFCKEKHEPNMSGEFDALMNAYETINRNREFDGEPPVRLWLLSNSSDIYNPIFVGLGIVNICERMCRIKKQHYYDKKRGLAIHILESSPDFVRKKKETALYRLTAGTRFADSALNNEFAYNDFSLIQSKSLKGYAPICSLSHKAYIYRKKGSNELYVTYANAQCPNFDIEHTQELKSFYSKYGFKLSTLFMKSAISFESYELKAIVLDIIL